MICKSFKPSFNEKQYNDKIFYVIVLNTLILNMTHYKQTGTGRFTTVLHHL